MKKAANSTGAAPTLKPRTKVQKVSLTDPDTKKTRLMSRSGAAARAIYKKQIVSGIEPAFVLPPDLRWVPDDFTEGGGRIVQRLAADIRKRTAYKSYLASYELHNTEELPKNDGFKLLYNFLPALDSMLKQHGGIKWNATARCLMRRELGGEVIEQSDNFYVPSRIRELNNSTQTRDQLTGAHDAMIAQVPEKELQGSGWVLHRVLTVAVDIGRLVPLKQGSWFDLPHSLMLKKAVVNVRNTDQQCFKWSVLSALFPAVKHADRVSKYAAHESELDWSGLSFPTPLDDIPKFERRNNVSINVYGWEGTSHYVPGEDDFDTDAQQKFASWRAEKETRKKLPRQQALKLYQTWGGKVTDIGVLLTSVSATRWLVAKTTATCCRRARCRRALGSGTWIYYSSSQVRRPTSAGSKPSADSQSSVPTTTKMPSTTAITVSMVSLPRKS